MLSNYLFAIYKDLVIKLTYYNLQGFKILNTLILKFKIIIITYYYNTQMVLTVLVISNKYNNIQVLKYVE